MTKKIVVTGIGASSPLGGTAPDSWKALLAGESGTHTLTHEWVEQYELPVKIAAEARVRPEDVLERQEIKRLDPSSQFALIASREAWADAGSPEIEPERFGVEYSTGIATDSVELGKSFTDDLDIDSISMMTIVVNAEEKFDVKIPDEEVKNLNTVGDAVTYIVNAQG